MNDYVKAIRAKIGHDRLMLAGAGVFVYRDGMILLQRRRDNGAWSDHGGCVEIGETVEDAAKRELFEETGLIAERLELFGVYSGEEMLYTYPNGDLAYIVGTYFLCTEFSGEMITQSDETLDLQWFPIDQLPENISPPERLPLRDFARRMCKGERNAGLA